MNIAPYGANKLCSQFRCVLWFVGNLFIFCYFFFGRCWYYCCVRFVSFNLILMVMAFVLCPTHWNRVCTRTHQPNNKKKKKIIHAEQWCVDGHESGPRSVHLITNSPICFPFIDSKDQHFTFVSMYIIDVHIAWLKHTHIDTEYKQTCTYFSA